MMAKPEYVPDILSPTARAQLGRQNRDVRSSALILDKDLLQIMKFILADLRVCGYNLLRRGAELQVA
jgi:hypothetical protein